MDKVIVSPLHEARDRLGLTIREAAERVGVSIGHLSDLEHGKADPSLSVARKIAKGYGVRVELLWPSDDQCPICEGRGWSINVPSQSMYPCSVCGGKGLRP